MGESVSEVDKPKTQRLLYIVPTALRSRDFLQFWIGMQASAFGSQMFRVGQFWLIYVITDSAWFLGYAGVANTLPGIFFNLFGGVLADKLDKRRLIISTPGRLCI